MNKIENPIVICGPTATGKTEVASYLAKLINGEIISADSRQVYKYLDIGTNKSGILETEINKRVVNGIAQHLTDLIDPSEIFNAGDFVRCADESIEIIKSKGKIPIITGGTGMYIKALIDGLAPLPERNNAFRDEVNEKIKIHGLQFVYDKLKEIDPQSALKNKDNPQRLIRALEVYYLTGTPISLLHAKTKKHKENFIKFGILWDREELYSNINMRSRQMIETGMIEETKKVMDMGFSSDCPGLQSIGYRDLVKYLKGEISIEQAEEFLKCSTRQYAKRQTTWFKKDGRITWINANKNSFNPLGAAHLIVKKLSNVI